MIPKILVVGLGGIGSNLLELIIPALERCTLKAEVSIMDDDIVEVSNIGHQRFTIEDIGTSKALALSKRFGYCNNVEIIPIEEKLSDKSQLNGFDIVIVAVDRMTPRRIVHESTAAWLDLRCQGDGYIVLDYLTEKHKLQLIPSSENPTSCQIEGAIEFQNIEFGFAICATIGAQWVLQKVRMIYGYKTKTPNFRVGSISDGELIISEGV